MECITPVRACLTDRFPVATFIVRVPSDRCFEIVCATEPNLFLPENCSRRTPDNFFTTRQEGLLRAPRGEVTYIIPGNQLHRFAGAKRLYYGMATYGDPTGKHAKLSINRTGIGSVPFIRFSPDFTGKSNTRPVLPASCRPINKEGTYGGRKPVLTWGGDMNYLKTDTTVASAGYDDGYDSSLWQQPPAPANNNSIGGNSYGDDYSYGTRSHPASIPLEDDEYVDAPDMTAKNGRFQIVSYPSRNAAQAQAAYGRGNEYGVAAVVPQPTYFGTEPEGYEDPRQLRREGGAHRQLEPRQVSAPQFHDPAITAGSGWYEYGCKAVSSPNTYCEEEPVAEVHTAEKNTAVAPRVLSLGEIFQKIIVPIASFESGLRPEYLQNQEQYRAQIAQSYAKTATDPLTGLSFGILQFKQAGPTLGKVLTACKNRNENLCRQLFGEHWDALCATTNSPTIEERMRPVGGLPLTDAYWIERFTQAGSNAELWPAQNEVAITWYFDRNKALVSLLDLTTDRAMSMFCDRCVAMGNAGGARWVLEAISPLTSTDLVAEAIRTTGYQNIGAFQSAHDLPASGELDIRTHAELLAALRSTGSGISVPSGEEMMNRMVLAAERQNQPWVDRIRALRNDTTLFSNQSFILE